MVLGAMVIVIVGILIVNYFKDKNSQTLPDALTTNETQVGKDHTVVKGETLWSISEDVYGSGYNWTDVYKANNLKGDKIVVGQVLSIPEVSVKEPTATKQVSTISQAQTIAGETYAVVHGDSLWNISVRAYGDGYKWTLVAKANNLKNPNLIFAGNVLVLPR